MGDPRLLPEPVLKSEVEKEIENLRESWRVVHGFFERLEAQHAPDAMLDELAELCDKYQEIHTRLSLLIPFFPEEQR